MSVALNVLINQEDASRLQDIMKWTDRNDISECTKRALRLYHKLLMSKRHGNLIQVFHPDGKIEDVEVR